MLIDIALDSSAVERDIMCWLQVKGRFSVKGAYLLEMGDVGGKSWQGWKRIWRLRVQQRVHVFIWMVAHDRILTNYRRWRCGLSGSSACTRCQGVTEDVLHVL